MGEANYYLKAQFASEDDLTAKLPALRTFFTQGANAYDFWQKNRMAKPETFWATFTKRYPLVAQLLGKYVGGDCNNALAGLIDFIRLDWAVFKQDKNTLYYGGTVWHFADWEPLCAFLQTQFGATKVKFLSDEYSHIPAEWKN